MKKRFALIGFLLAAAIAFLLIFTGCGDIGNDDTDDWLISNFTSADLDVTAGERKITVLSGGTEKEYDIGFVSDVEITLAIAETESDDETEDESDSSDSDETTDATKEKETIDVDSLYTEITTETIDHKDFVHLTIKESVVRTYRVYNTTGFEIYVYNNGEITEYSIPAQTTDSSDSTDSSSDGDDESDSSDTSGYTEITFTNEVPELTFRDESGTKYSYSTSYDSENALYIIRL